jgi:hypothetical protein
MRKILISLFWLLIISGLIIRLLSISYMGIFDMAVYHEWGINTLKNGLNSSYQSGYFPFQYQIFEFGSWLSIKLKTEYFIVYKTINLLFDCGNLIVLYMIFRKIRVSKFYLLLYWLHPWFLLIHSQGYCDVQFTFFILCTLFFALKASSRNYLIAGIFMGFAFLMKPQIQIIVLSFFVYSLYLYYKNRDIKTLHLFIFPAILFLDYSLYFFIESGNPFRLLRAYVDAGSSMPLTANFLNGWFPVAYWLKSPDDPIYTVMDDLTISNFTLRSMAVLSVLFLIYFLIKKLSNKIPGHDYNYNLFLIACFSTFIFPFVMTSAHENHLYLATVLLIPILGKIKNLLPRVCIHVILLIQCINLYGFYGLADSKNIAMINITYTYEMAFVLSLIAFSAFIILVVYFLNPKSDFLTQFKQPVGD